MKAVLRRFKFAVCLPLWFACVFCAGAAVSVGELRCEHLDNPSGVDAMQPRLSWVLKSSERDQKQTAYQIMVATSETMLKSGSGDLWDSGKVASDQSIQVAYAGKPLASRQACFWKVRVWDKNGTVSAWSQPAQWSMGLLNPDDWSPAKWIGLDGVNKTDYLADTSWIWFPTGDPAVSAAPATN